MQQTTQRDLTKYPLQVWEEVMYNKVLRKVVKITFGKVRLFGLDEWIHMENIAPVHPFPPLPDGLYLVSEPFYYPSLYNKGHKVASNVEDYDEDLPVIDIAHHDYWMSQFHDAILSEKIEEEGRRMYGEQSGLSEKKEYDFECSNCGKGFNSLDALAWHKGAKCDTINLEYPIAKQQPTDRDRAIVKWIIENRYTSIFGGRMTDTEMYNILLDKLSTIPPVEQMFTREQIDKGLTVKSDERNITIKIPVDILKFAAENKEWPLIVNDSVEFAKKIAFKLENSEDHVGSKFTGLQTLIDKYMDEVLEDGEDCVWNPNEQ